MAASNTPYTSVGENNIASIKTEENLSARALIS